jgi:hypothetical protein
VRTWHLYYPKLFAMAKWGMVSYEIAAWGGKLANGTPYLVRWPVKPSLSGKATWPGGRPDWAILEVHTHPLRDASGNAYQQEPSSTDDIPLAINEGIPVFALTRKAVYVVGPSGTVYTLTDGQSLWWK